MINKNFIYLYVDYIIVYAIWMRIFKSRHAQRYCIIKAYGNKVDNETTHQVTKACVLI